jgi:hypothetical protein
MSTDTSTLPTREVAPVDSERSMPPLGASGIAVPGASLKSIGDTVAVAEVVSSDHWFNRPTSAGTRSCTDSRHVPSVLRPRNVASAGSAVSS